MVLLKAFSCGTLSVLPVANDATKRSKKNLSNYIKMVSDQNGFQCAISTQFTKYIIQWENGAVQVILCLWILHGAYLSLQLALLMYKWNNAFGSKRKLEDDRRQKQCRLTVVQLTNWFIRVDFTLARIVSKLRQRMPVHGPRCPSHIFSIRLQNWN